MPEPDVISFNTLISACGHDRDLDSAVKVFNQMGQRRVRPNIRTYCALLHTAARAGQVNNNERCRNR
eukprot:1182662-Pyramimonas_sp.AAC.1